jgi:hypothetical protein
MMAQTPSGATGDSSMDSKAAAASSRCRVDFDETALIDDRRLHETVAIPLFDEVSGPPSGRSRVRDLHQERPEARCRQAASELVVHG